MKELIAEQATPIGDAEVPYSRRALLFERSQFKESFARKSIGVPGIRTAVSAFAAKQNSKNKNCAVRQPFRSTAVVLGFKR